MASSDSKVGGKSTKKKDPEIDRLLKEMKSLDLSCVKYLPSLPVGVGEELLGKMNGIFKEALLNSSTSQSIVNQVKSEIKKDLQDQTFKKLKEIQEEFEREARYHKRGCFALDISNMAHILYVDPSMTERDRKRDTSDGSDPFGYIDGERTMGKFIFNHPEMRKIAKRVGCEKEGKLLEELAKIKDEKVHEYYRQKEKEGNEWSDGMLKKAIDLMAILECEEWIFREKFREIAKEYGTEFSLKWFEETALKDGEDSEDDDE